MKKKLFQLVILCIFIMSKSTFAIAEDNNISHEGKWQCILEAGITARFCRYEEHYTVTEGRRFNRFHFLGAGVGYQRVFVVLDRDDYGNGDPNHGYVPFLPIFAEYDLYVPFRHHPNHSFLFACQGGIGYYPDKTLSMYDTERWDPFARCKVGLDFQIYKKIGLQVSLQAIEAKFGGLGVGAGIRF